MMDKHYSVQAIPLFVWGVALYILNLVDMMSTLVFVKGYDAIELNPVVDLMLQANPFWFILFKVGGVGFFIALLCNASERLQLRRKALMWLTGLYFLLFLWHLAHHIWFGLAGAF